GKLTELLLTNGNPVTAIEPNAQMRQMAEERLSGEPNFRSLAATAEQTTLPDHSVRFITVAQAFHWFDRQKVRPEFVRILQVDGWLCLIWNERKADPGSFGEAFKAITAQFTIENRVEYHRALTENGFQLIRDFFAPCKVDLATFPNEQILDRQGLIGRVLSNSNSPLEGHPLYPAMIDRLNQLFDRFQVGGAVRFEYDTRIYYGRLA
ncbi:MAG TPA: class I SAM-dependent methyltransferase, partial [Tepidisphaeraceae bacterium]|nr:class I SAM-dependent methyltransferase [Tepidisphaeraceae bacterium]